MDAGPAHLRMLSRIFMLFLVLFFGLSLWLLIAPPSILAPYHFWFPYAICLVFGLWFLSSGLFFHSRFAKVIGTGPDTPLVSWFGPKGARLFFLLAGLFMLTLTGGTLLLHWLF